MNTSTKKRILVVDDESVLRMLLIDVLSEAGYSVDAAEDGIDALEQIKKAANYDLMLVDIIMPKMDGITLCRKIREDFPALKQRLLFLTGYAPDEALSFLKEHNYKYIDKPFKTQYLLKEINTMLVGEEVAVTEDVLWKTGTDRRTEDRFLWSEYCYIFDDKIYNPISLLAKTQDISQNGAKIKYVGEPLSPGCAVNIHMKNLNIQRVSKIMWSKTINKLDSLSGMRFMEPIQVPLSIRRPSLNTL